MRSGEKKINAFWKKEKTMSLFTFIYINRKINSEQWSSVSEI